MARRTGTFAIVVCAVILEGARESQTLRGQGGTASLLSWNQGRAREAIASFVQRVTQPIYFQMAFALDRVKALAPGHPDWKEKQPFKGVLEGSSQIGFARRATRSSIDHTPTSSISRCSS